MCRFIGSNKHGWFHDGITTGEVCEAVGEFGELTEKDLKTFKTTVVVVAIYTI